MNDFKFLIPSFVRFFVIGIVLISATSCNDASDSGVALGSLDYEVHMLKAKVKRLEEDCDAQGEENANLLNRIIDLELNEEEKKTAIFSISSGLSDGFHVLETSTGSFLIMLKEITPYLSGYKLVFSIGNPSLAIYENATLKVRWNRSYKNWKEDKEYALKMDKYQKEHKEYLDSIVKGNSCDLERPEFPKRPLWSEEFKEKDFALKTRLNPGAWNTIEVHVSPATLEQLDCVEVQLDAPTVILNKENGLKS